MYIDNSFYIHYGDNTNIDENADKIYVRHSDLLTTSMYCMLITEVTYIMAITLILMKMLIRFMLGTMIY